MHTAALFPLETVRTHKYIHASITGKKKVSSLAMGDAKDIFRGRQLFLWLHSWVFDKKQTIPYLSY